MDQLAAEEYGLSTLVLMENAGAAVARVVRSLSTPAGQIAVVCGKGNNGGDGLVAARHLDGAGFCVCVVMNADAEQCTPDTRTNLHAVERAGIPVTDEIPGDVDVIIDALLGIGVRGAVRSVQARLIESVNDRRASGARVIAVDIPSGLDANTGEPCGTCVVADETVTFVAAKQGFGHPAAPPYLGRVRVANIGIPAALLRQFAD